MFLVGSPIVWPWVGTLVCVVSHLRARRNASIVSKCGFMPFFITPPVKLMTMLELRLAHRSSPVVVGNAGTNAAAKKGLLGI